jgi:predicted transposase/invertase (TIGR01784 family)
MFGRKLVSFDWAMKKLLRSKANYEILEGFLSELLKEDIKIQEILESETNQDSRDDKYNRVDLKVKNSEGEILLIEVQYNNQYDYFHRILYSSSKTITEHIDKGDEYLKVTKVISVNILYFDLGHGKDYVYHGTTNFRGIHENDELELNEKQKELFLKENPEDIFPEYYLLKVNNFNDIAKDSLDEWIYFLKNGDIKEEFKAKGLKKADIELEVLKLDKKDYAAYDKYIEDRRYERSLAGDNYRSGKIDGKKEGIKEGMKEGIDKGKIEAAKNLLDILEPKVIAQKLGLSLLDVEKLKK